MLLQFSPVETFVLGSDQRRMGIPRVIIRIASHESEVSKKPSQVFGSSEQLLAKE